MAHPRIVSRLPAFVAVLAGLCLHVLSLTAPAWAAPKPDDIRREIQAALTEQVAQWNKGDLAGYLGFYQTTPDLAFVLTDKINKGFDELRKMYERVFRSQKMGTMRYEDTEVYPLSDNNALSTSRFTISIDGQGALGGVVTYAWTRTPQGWRIFLDHRTVGAPRTAGASTVVGDELVTEDVVVGKGDTALAGKEITAHYLGTFTDGRKFDSSYDRGQPFTFRLGAGEVIPGWDKGVVGMKVGGKRRLLIPSHLGYGARGQGSIPPNTPLVFEVELLEVK